MAIQYYVYFKKYGEDWELLDTTSDTSIDIDSDEYTYSTVYQWRVDTLDDETGLLTTGDTWRFTTKLSLYYNRPTDYDPDDSFDQATETWVSDFDVTGGGRYGIKLIAVGQDDDGKGVIYYG